MRRLTILTTLVFVCIFLSAQLRQTRMCIWNNGTCDKVWVESGIDSITFAEESMDDVLKYAYTSANNGVICEYSSDNVIDNNVPDPRTGHANDVAPLHEMYNEIFAWLPVTSSDGNDSPAYIWKQNYRAIVAANQVLKLLNEMSGNTDAEKGEALLIRAYHHFLLVNIFCQAWKNVYDSKSDLGIPYLYDTKYTINSSTQRGSVYDTYNAIQSDLEEGLNLLSKSNTELPSSRMNIKAAHAFAARFYLYKREWAKVVEHADYVLTTNDQTTLLMLFDATTNRNQSNIELAFNHYINPNAPCNLLIYNTYSSSPYAHFPSYGRYQYNGDAQEFTTYGAGPCWTGQFPGIGIWSADQKLGGFCAKDYYWFEYTDTVNGYGYIRGVTRAFTTNETLLCRAEAKVYLNDLDGAVNDFRLWCQSYNVGGRMQMLADSTVDLSQEKIVKFYGEKAGTKFAPVLHNQDIAAEWVITPEQLPLVHCALHFRRIETLHDGLRWHDLKRYGIEIEHVQGKDPARILVWNDDRRAIQLPQEIIKQGLTPNPRIILGDNVDSTTPLLIQSKKGKTATQSTTAIQEWIHNLNFTTK